MTTVGNVKNLELLQKVCNIVGHIAMGFQLIFVLMIFLCCFYVACSIFEWHILDFLNPFIESVENFSSLLFGNNIKNNAETSVDGRIVLFILFSVVVAYFMSQIKLACKNYDKILAGKIVIERQKVEATLNASLQSSVKVDLISQNNYVIAVQFLTKYLVQDNMGVVMPSKEDILKVKLDMVASFYEMMKDVPDLRFSKDGDVLLIAGSNVNNVDATIDSLWSNIERLKIEYRMKKYALRAKLAMECFKPLVPISTSYKVIKPLLSLNATDEILCYGNTRNRYDMIPKKKYVVAVKGKFELDGKQEETIWSILKKTVV